MLVEIKNLVREECNKESNPFGSTAFVHISDVVKFSKLLAKKLNADEEIAEIAAWLHDWGSIIGRYEDHHIVGSEEAENILKEFNYPQEKIERIKHCILTHRGSKYIKRESVEAEIVASADAMSHFTNIPDLFHLAYSTKKMSYEEGAKFVRDKLERSWNKIMPEGKEIIKEKYDAALKILEDVT